MAKNKGRDTLAFCLGILLIGALMHLIGAAKGNHLVFPAVGDILDAFFRLLGQSGTYRQMGVTLLHLIEALALSTLLGGLLGLLSAASPFIRTLFKPLLFFLRSIPMIVMVVAVMILMPRTQYERVPRITGCLLLVPLISEAVAEGCRRIEPEMIDVYRMNSRFNLRVLLQVYLPLTAGYLKQAYVSCVGMGLRMVVSTEYLVQTRHSLGKAMFDQNYHNEYANVYAYALLMILLVLLLSELPTQLIKALQKRKKGAPALPG